MGNDEIHMEAVWGGGGAGSHRDRVLAGTGGRRNDTAEHTPFPQTGASKFRLRGTPLTRHHGQHAWNGSAQVMDNVWSPGTSGACVASSPHQMWWGTPSIPCGPGMTECEASVSAGSSVGAKGAVLLL